MDGNSTGPVQGPRLHSARRTFLPVGVAALAALAVAGGLDVVHHHERVVAKERTAKPASAKTPKKKPAQTALPRYVVGVRRPGNALVVRDIRTGKDVGLPVAAPPGQLFQRIARGGGGTYVVAAAAGKKVTFQRLRLEKDGRPKEMAPIPNAVVSGVSTAASDLAVSPDGTHIAYVTYRGTAGRVDVLTPASGERKTWTSRTTARISSLSWAGDTLSFVWSPSGRKAKAAKAVRQVRTLDTTLAPGSLRVSKSVLRLPAGSGTAVLSPDGRSVTTGVPERSETTLRTYSIETGKPTKDLWTQEVQGGLRRLDIGGGPGHLLAYGADGRLYIQGAPAVPAADLADAAW
ncbi:TolB-like translocation protein [Actinomadura macrotermitis]|uniref:Lipoprotein LpqB beta-propeller domain-containing protein n=1 Tax=Actinomadura macrotermitis TaxID=2585200 RepID=A0A7K0BXJ2_9ACTN|nr:PD40 domain-containing protein [Actinomadura macrotermitis]MQY05901.1 hypothetical protein [Actinomadura macrotermitis]